MTHDMRRALAERHELIAADAVLDTDRNAGEPWTRSPGEPPGDSRKAAAWRRHARPSPPTAIDTLSPRTPLGPAPEDAAQQIDTARARTALERVEVIAHPYMPIAVRDRRPEGSGLAEPVNGSSALGRAALEP